MFLVRGAWFLVNCDICVEFSDNCRRIHFNWSVCIWSEEEGCIDMVENSFISRVVIFIVLSAWMSEILLAFFVLIFILTASILFPTLLLTLTLSRRSSEYVVSEVMCFSCAISFEENLVVVSLITLVLSESRIVSDLILTSS